MKAKLLIIVVAIALLFSACGSTGRTIQTNATAQPSATPKLPTSTVIPTGTPSKTAAATQAAVTPATVAPSAVPTWTPIPQSVFAAVNITDELFNAGTFAGVLPSFAADNVKDSTPVTTPGFYWVTGNETKVGPWTQPTYIGDIKNCVGDNTVSPQVDYLTENFVFSVPPGKTLDCTFIFNTELLQRADGSTVVYNALVNAATYVKAVGNAWVGEFATDGVALTAPKGIDVEISYAGGASCTAPSVQLVEDVQLHVKMACPANSPINCDFRAGQYGKMTSLRTGLPPQPGTEEGDKDQGGNKAKPGCLMPGFPESTYAWIQTLK